jgi:hypothetical protein
MGWLAATLTLAACGKGREPGQDWSGIPLDTTYAAKINNVAITVRGPAHMKLDEGAHKATDADLTKTWLADVDDYFSEPDFQIGFESIPATTIDEFVKSAMVDPKHVITKQAATADGFVVAFHSANNGLLGVATMKTKGANHLTCNASQAKTGGVPSPDKTLAWLEQLCASLTIQ